MEETEIESPTSWLHRSSLPPEPQKPPQLSIPRCAIVTSRSTSPGATAPRWGSAPSLPHLAPASPGEGLQSVQGSRAASAPAPLRLHVVSSTSHCPPLAAPCGSTLPKFDWGIRGNSGEGRPQRNTPRSSSSSSSEEEEEEEEGRTAARLCGRVPLLIGR
ncbi:unnamed protein product [Pleuronectes platessa]|uniref:Uncharacterized protein n=1 Tax=Pleuronectes platessa TaxID=8262 RepID=A0A9N7Y7K0_PLEPL|nr:unnamed protein product [Pleuronectes platessa]